MLHVSQYRARLAEERKKEEEMTNDSNSRPFQVCHFKIVTTRYNYYCRLGQVLYKLLDVLLDMNIYCPAMISPCSNDIAVIH